MIRRRSFPEDHFCFVSSHTVLEYCTPPPQRWRGRGISSGFHDRRARWLSAVARRRRLAALRWRGRRGSCWSPGVEMKGDRASTPPRSKPVQGGAQNPPAGARPTPSVPTGPARQAGGGSRYTECCPNQKLQAKNSGVGCCILLYAIFCFVAAFTTVCSFLSRAA